MTSFVSRSPVFANFSSRPVPFTLLPKSPSASCHPHRSQRPASFAATRAMSFSSSSRLQTFFNYKFVHLCILPSPPVARPHRLLPGLRCETGRPILVDSTPRLSKSLKALSSPHIQPIHFLFKPALILPSLSFILRPIAPLHLL